jgi:hypothetical protein
MDVTNGREQVMLHLEVHPLQIPSCGRIRRRKIRGRFHLMHGPFVCYPRGAAQYALKRTCENRQR